MVSLKDKMLGCIAGVHIGSSMGAVVEGWSYDKIEKTYGTVNKLMPYEHYGNNWLREAGTTEDGVERQKLMITAIMEKQDRINAEDLKQTWVKHIKPISIGMVSEAFEATLLKMAQSNIPACDIGRYCDYSGLNSMSRACHPLGLINAGDVKGAIDDIMEVGQLYQTTNSSGLKWACVIGVAIAQATKKDATVDSVINAILNNCNKQVADEIERELEHTKNCRDFSQLRETFDSSYSGHGMSYAHSFANEVVTKGVCIFKMVEGNPRDAIIAGVNLGRDTDCLAAVSAGISGALSGSSSIPQEWMDQIDGAVSRNKYTNTQRTLIENADGLYDAYIARLNKMQNFVDTMIDA